MVWKPIHLSPSAGAHLPPLLVSTSFTPSSYTIHLTDLTHIWSESLDYITIIRRSRGENTSIDPSDGDQLQIFLEKIKLGLAGSKDTTLALTIKADADRPSLVLNISVKLPGGLAPLEWPVQLAAAPQSLMTSQLTVPLLRAQHARMQEMASLAEVLRDKDHVIQKLVDKLEGQGTELGQIFPQAAGKIGRKLDRKRAEERVKGLGQFDLEAWKKSQGHETSRDTAQLIGDVFAGDDSKAVGIDGGTPASEEGDSWWESIKGITVNLDSGKISTNGPARAHKTPPKSKLAFRKEESIEDSDDFQVQATPPHLASPPKRAASKPVIGDSTDDDEDLDAPSQHSKIPDSFPSSPPPTAPSSQKPKKLGAIGSKNVAPKLDPRDEESTEGELSSPPKAGPQTKAASPIPEKAAVKSQKKFGRIGGKKEAPLPEQESECEVSPPVAKTTPPPEAPKAKKGKLGQIGGNKKRADTPPPPEEARPEPEPSTSSTTPKPKRKLGAIGHKHQSPATKNEESPSKIEENESRERPSVKPEKETTPPPPETSQERADKKRLQLKRELEEKAKAPVKKKRKF